MVSTFSSQQKKKNEKKRVVSAFSWCGSKYRSAMVFHATINLCCFMGQQDVRASMSKAVFVLASN